MAVYFDHNASTAVHPEVLEAMLPFIGEYYGNPSSLHRSGRFLRSAIETARRQVADLVNAEAGNIVFTSGGTESNNLALKGFLPRISGSTVLASSIEHASVLEPLSQLEEQGNRTALLPTQANGSLDQQAARRLIDEVQPDLISVQLANNETGVIQPLEPIARYAHKHACRVHTDATQGIGRLRVDCAQLDVDLMTISGHKFGAPKGVGALIIRNGTPISQLISGGPQESGRRAGTENVAAIVGLGKAAELAQSNLLERQTFLLELRRYCEAQLRHIPQLRIFGEDAERLPNTSFFALPYYHGETLLMQLDKAGFELASGSACHSEVTRPSHVLSAMGVDEDLALNAVRVSFGMHNTRQQIDQFVAELNNLINQLPAVIRQAVG